MNELKITIADTLERDTAVRAVVAAFSGDPAARWMYSDSERYQEYFPVLVNVFAGASFEHASAYCYGTDAAALWLPPGIHPDEDALAELIRRSFPARDQAEVFAFFGQMDSYHPSEPHWYLPMIGVVPEKQGQGYGSALLQPVLKRCDAESKLAYLEASSPKSVPLYERHGFELLGKTQAGSSPTMFPMVRKPRPWNRHKGSAGFSRPTVQSMGARLELK
jgi:GNAT superfamily N-acetyltransferase